jgi:hypothetical protein
VSREGLKINTGCCSPMRRGKGRQRRYIVTVYYVSKLSRTAARHTVAPIGRKEKVPAVTASAHWRTHFGSGIKHITTCSEDGAT